MITFELVTLAGVKHREQVHEVLLPTPEGQIAVFANHAPLVTVTSHGIIHVRREANHPDDMLKDYAVNAGGVIEINDNSVRVLVDEAEQAQEIDEKQAAEALEKAKQLAKQARDQKSLDEALSMLDRQTTRLKIAELRRHRRSKS